MSVWLCQVLNYSKSIYTICESNKLFSSHVSTPALFCTSRLTCVSCRTRLTFLDISIAFGNSRVNVYNHLKRHVNNKSSTPTALFCQDHKPLHRKEGWRDENTVITISCGCGRMYSALTTTRTNFESVYVAV